MLERLKKKWGVHSAWRVVVICIVFSLAGMSILPVRKAVFHLLHYDAHTPFWLKTVTWIAIVFPTYQVFLLVFGTLFGEFRFFWEKEKAMARWISRRFRSPEAYQ